jgi:creatinine amidohydrolase/Fe(II)-dependent formamide hydrolase-like protein
MLMRIGEMTWTEVRERAAQGVAAIVPLGSTEEQGPHAPMGDYIVIDAIAGRTGDATGDLVVPTVPFGYSEYFRVAPWDRVTKLERVRDPSPLSASSYGAEADGGR